MQSIPGKYPAKYPVYRASHIRYLQRNFALAIDRAKRVRRKFFGRCVPSVRASLLSSQCPSRINGFSQRLTAVPDALQSHSVRTRHHARALGEGEALPGGYRVPRLVYSSFSSADDKSRDGTDACQAYVQNGSPLSSVLAVPSAYVTMMTRSVRPAVLQLVLPRKLRCLK